jgi:chromosome segregation ATPase
MDLKEELKAKIDALKAAIDQVEDKVEGEIVELLEVIKKTLETYKDMLDNLEDNFVIDLKEKIDAIEIDLDSILGKLEDLGDDIDELIDDQEWIPEETQSFLMKYKWYIIGGVAVVVVIGALALIF